MDCGAHSVDRTIICSENGCLETTALDTRHLHSIIANLEDSSVFSSLVFLVTNKVAWSIVMASLDRIMRMLPIIIAVVLQLYNRLQN